MAGIRRVHRARGTRRCDSRFYEGGCIGRIEAGERYGRTAWPPQSNPLYQDTWVTLNECEACASWCGRPLDEPVPPVFAMEVDPDRMEVTQ